MNHLRTVGTPRAGSVFLRLLFCVGAVALLAACAGTTKVKYIYHHATGQIVRPIDGQVLTAPPGKHYGVFLVTCVDNSDRDDAFSFSTTRLRTDAGNTMMTPLSGQFPPFNFSVAPGAVAQAPEDQSLAKVVFLIDAPAEGGVIRYLNHASQPGQSVLMVNQTSYGPLVSSGNAPTNYEEIDGSPFLGSNTCANSGSSPHG